MRLANASTVSGSPRGKPFKHMKPAKSNQFAIAIGDIDKGKFVDALSEALAEICEACKQSDKKGTLSVKITVAPAGNAFQIGGTYNTTLPRPDFTPVIRYADKDGVLLLRDPDQNEFPEVVKTVDKAGELPEKVASVGGN